jgi:polyhydroxybutyrate depolymerase
MTTTYPVRLTWPCLLIASLGACSGTEPPGDAETGGAGQGAAGGSGPKGGSSGAGGAGASAGGTGGVAGSSGASTTGGTFGKGGGSGAAGAAAGTTASGGSGGSGQAGGGAGRGSGGNAMGGGAGTGGSGGSAGSSAGTGGSGGSAGGSAGTGGSGGRLSAGCGTPTTLTSERTSIDVAGTMREYVLDIPDDYDPSKPYKLIFGWHWRGGVANDVVSGQIIGGPYYGLKSRSNGSAIFVSPEGIEMGWANSSGRDIAFLRAMLDHFNANLCIDQSRIFSTGFSYGGMMSDAFYSGCREPNMNPIAVWLAHGDNDTVVSLADGQEVRDKFLERNGCGTTTTPTEPSPCVSYDGCADGYPVVYCEFSGGHSPASFGPDAIWNFFDQF